MLASRYMLVCRHIIASQKKIKKFFFFKSMPHMYTDARPRVSNVGDCNTLKLFSLKNIPAATPHDFQKKRTLLIQPITLETLGGAPDQSSPGALNYFFLKRHIPYSWFKTHCSWWKIIKLCNEIAGRTVNRSFKFKRQFQSISPILLRERERASEREQEIVSTFPFFSH